MLEALSSQVEGLTAARAAELLTKHGPNRFTTARQISAFRILADQFRSVVVLLLVAAALVALAMGEQLEALAIVAILVINAAIGFISELRARSAMAALLELEVPEATVVRDGATEIIPSHDLVPGDVIVLEAGQAVPADGRLLEAAELRVNEAPLTGESVPVSKAVDPLPAETGLADRLNMIHMSTAVVGGSGRAVVTATGMATEVGKIGGLVSGVVTERTPLEDKLDALGRRLIVLTLIITAVVVGLGVWRGSELGLMVETGLALAIAAVPEGLAAVSTIALAVGVSRMAQRNALVRRLPAVEALGSATIICTDKTGTLTAGEMTVTSLWAGEVSYQISGTGYVPEGKFSSEEAEVAVAESSALERALLVGALANTAGLEEVEGEWQIRGDPTEAALLVAAAKAGMHREALLAAWQPSGELPFSSERMLMATYHQHEGEQFTLVKGAPARVVERSTSILTSSGETRPLDAEGREAVLEVNRKMASDGLRVLALAQGHSEMSEPEELTLVGLVGMSDPPAEGVQDTIASFREAGIRTLMITGDQRLTAAAVAQQLGILAEGEEATEGKDLEGLSAQELGERLTTISALSRVTPEQKLRIVEALQERGQIVAMLGDGVNDAPALKRADIGVAMGGRGTDVAKEAAAVVLTDDRFPTIGAAIEEGRVIFDNIRKFVFYLFSCNVAEVLVILGASLLAMPQPLLPLQILWLNLVTDTFPALSLAMEPAEEDVMQRPPADPHQAILSRPFVIRILGHAALITAVTLIAFAWALNGQPDNSTRAVTVAFMTLALAQIFHLGNARSSAPVLTVRRIMANRWAIGAVVLTVGLQLLALNFAPLAGLLGVAPLPSSDWLVVVLLALVPAVMGQMIALVRSRQSTD